MTDSLIESSAARLFADNVDKAVRDAAERAARTGGEVPGAGGGAGAEEAIEKRLGVHAPEVVAGRARFKPRRYFPPSTLITCPLM